MVSGLSQLVLLALCSMGLTTSSGIGLMKYRSYGPMMCLQVCGDSGGSFILLEGYHCRRIFQKDPQTFKTLSSEDSFRCFNIYKMPDYGTSLRHSPREDTFNVSAKVTLITKVQPDFTTDSICDQHLKWAQNLTLHRACKEGRLPAVRCLLNGLDINAKGKLGQTAVMVAAKNGHFVVFDFLVRKGCDLSLIDDFNDTILHAACEGGSLAMVQDIVSIKVVGIDSRGNKGMTPVMMAALMGHREIFNFLKKRGCNLKVVLEDNYTILHVACIGGHINMVKHIVSLGIIDIDSRGWIGRTPVMTAAVTRHREVVAFLVSEGCDMELVDDLNSNVLHVACLGGDAATVKYIMTLNVIDLDSEGQAGRTPIMMAAMKNWRDVFDLLARAGCSLTVVDNQRCNILHLACYFGAVNMVNYILSLNITGVGLESRGELGRTPVMLAALVGQIEIFDLLMRKGCNLTTVDAENSNILHLACTGGHVSMVKHIVSLHIFDIDSRGWKGRTPVMTAAAKGHREVVTYLVSKGCDMKLVDDMNSNVLNVACFRGDVATVKYIMALNVIDLDTEGQAGRTPIMMATMENQRDVFDLLARAGCSLTAVDKQGCNILHLACYFGAVNMVNYILSLNITGVGLESRGESGRTPVMLATAVGQIEIFDLLMRKGSNLTSVDADDSNILHLACLGGNVDMVKFVLKLKVVKVNCKNKYGRTPEQVARHNGNTAVVNPCGGRI